MNGDDSLETRLFNNYRLNSSGNGVDDDKSSELRIWRFVPEAVIIIYISYNSASYKK